MPAPRHGGPERHPHRRVGHPRAPGGDRGGEEARASAGSPRSRPWASPRFNEVCRDSVFTYKEEWEKLSRADRLLARVLAAVRHLPHRVHRVRVVDPEDVRRRGAALPRPQERALLPALRHGAVARTRSRRATRTWRTRRSPSWRSVLDGRRCARSAAAARSWSGPRRRGRCPPTSASPCTRTWTTSRCPRDGRRLRRGRVPRRGGSSARTRRSNGAIAAPSWSGSATDGRSIWCPMPEDPAHALDRGRRGLRDRGGRHGHRAHGARVRCRRLRGRAAARSPDAQPRRRTPAASSPRSRWSEGVFVKDADADLVEDLTERGVAVPTSAA